MPYKDGGLFAFIADWWQFGAYLIGGIALYITGRERQRYRVDEVGRDVSTLKRDLAEMKSEFSKGGRDHAAEIVTTTRALAEISTGQAHILRELGQLREELRGKADK